MAEKDDNSNFVSDVNSNPPVAFASSVDREKIPENILEFEKLISGFSTVMKDAPEESLENELNNWLKKFVEFLKVDRCIVDEYLDDKKTIHLLMNYIVPEIEPITVVNNFKPLDGVLKELEKGVVIRAEKIPEDLPQIFRGGLIEKDKIKSLVIVPLSIGNKVIGSLAFSCYRKERKWSNNLVRRIKLIGEIIANTILRIRSHKSLMEMMEQRKQLEETYSSVIKNANLGFMIISLLDHSIIDVNDEYCRMSGYSREELINKKTWDIDASMDSDEVIKYGELATEKGSIHIITTHKRKDGSLFDVEVSSNLFAKDNNIVYSFVRDITDLNQTRKELEERLEFEELISEFSAALISPGDFHSELNKWIQKFVDFLKVDRGMIAEHFEDLRTIKILVQYSVPGVDVAPLEELTAIPEDEVEGFQKGLFLRAEKIPDDLPQNLRGGPIERDNTRSVIIVPLSVGSNVIGHLTFASHINEHKWSDDIVRRIKLIGEIIANAILRKHSSDALHEEVKRRKMLEEKYSSILKNASVGFMITDLSDFSVIDVNDEYCRMSGYNRDEIISRKIWEFDASQNLEKVKQDKRSMMDQDGAIHHETSHIRKDGSVFDVAISSNLYEKDNIVCAFIRDVTDVNNAQKEQEERFRFEELVSEFSAALININPDEIKGELEKWIRKIVYLLGLDRGTVHEYIDEQEITQVMMHYTVPEVNLPTELRRPASDGLLSALAKGEIIRAEKIPEDLPQSLRGGIIEKDKTKSLVIVPLLTGNKVFGNFSLASYRKERKWSDDLIRRIKLLGEIIGNAILRIRSHENLIRETEQRKKLEDRYSSIIKNANIGFWISDSDQNILIVNDEYCRMSGYSHEELLSIKIPEIDISFEKGKENITEEIMGIGASHHEVTHRKKDGTSMDLDVSSTLLKRENLLFSFMRDITELNQRRKEQEERLRFEEVVSEFSTALINIRPEDIKSELGKWLEKFVELMDVDRCAVNEYGDDQQIIKNLMQYSVPEVNVPVPDMRKTPQGEITELEKGIIRAEKIPEDLPQMFYGSFIERSKARSHIIVPLLTGNRIFGNLAFTSYRKECKWSDELIRRIKLIGEIVGNAILRLRSYEALLEEMERRQRLEERYTSIIKNANVGFWVTKNQNILVVNDEYCRMSGYSREELLKMKVSDIDISKDLTKVGEDEGKTIREGASHHESRHIRKDGKVIDVEINSSYLEKEGIIFSFSRDITELNKARKKLEERLEFEGLVSEFSAALINVKIDNIKNGLNIWLRRFAEFLNIDKCGIGEFEDEYNMYRFICSYINPMLNPLPPPFASAPTKPYGFTDFLKKGETIILDSVDKAPPKFSKQLVQKLYKDGTKSLLIFPLISGDVLLGSMIIACITSERSWPQEMIRELKLVAEIFANALMRDKRDSELDKYREHLEKMVDERTAELKNAQRELVVSEKMATLGRLTATVSHELRNPLGTIRSSVFSIQKRYKGHDKKLVTALERAERNIRRCDLIIEELLDYSRIHDLKLAPTQIDDWITEVLDETVLPAGISILKDLDARAAIEMDHERFRRSIVNILTNACQAIEEKGADEPGYVHVKTRQASNKIIIEISDNGVGFDMVNKNKLFEPLFSTKAFGVGLGIPITVQVIEQHGWEMDITGEPQKGASVIITIPVD